VSKSPELRVRLRAFLEVLHDRYEAADPTEERLEILQLLEPVLSALDDLDHGQTPPVFKPTPTKRHTARPADARRLQRSALRYEASLRRQGMSQEQARGAVADAYAVSIETIRSWKKKLNLESPGEVDATLRQDRVLARSYRILGAPIRDVAHILQSAARAGNELRKIEPKKAKAKGKKKPPLAT
jgi:hypothetical protein